MLSYEVVSFVSLCSLTGRRRLKRHKDDKNDPTHNLTQLLSPRISRVLNGDLSPEIILPR